jgi:hypothetical protein
MAETAIKEREASFDFKAAFNADFGEGDAPVVEEKIEDNNTPDTNEKTDGVDTTEVKVDDKVEKPEEKKEEVVEIKTEEKTEDKPEEAELVLKAEDIQGYVKPAEEGSWKAVGQLFEVDVPEETPEAVVAAVKAKYEPLIEEARKQTIENEYAKLKPETVTALKLIEMGIPESEAFNPTAKHVELLKMDDAALVRTNLEGLDGWDEERVNLEMEDLISNPAKLKHEALKLKEYLTSDANAIIAKREAMLNEYTQNKERAATQEKEVSFNQVKDAVMTIDSFMGAKIDPEAKQVMLQKHSRGEYGNIKGDAKDVAELICFKEFGKKIIEETKRASFAKGREEFAKKELLRIPTKEGEPSKKVVEKVTQNNQSNNPASILSKDFG